MALGAGLVYEFLILKRRDQIVALISRSVRRDGHAHVAVGTGEHISVNAALARECLKFGMVYHYLTDTVVRIDVVCVY